MHPQYGVAAGMSLNRAASDTAAVAENPMANAIGSPQETATASQRDGQSQQSQQQQQHPPLTDTAADLAAEDEERFAMESPLRRGWYFELPNRVRCALVEERLPVPAGGAAAAAVAATISRQLVTLSACVAVGWTSDPPEIQGMARLVERLILLGSASYPEENGLRNLCASHGGTLSSTAGDDHISVTLEVPVHALPLAADMLGDLLTRPLLPLEFIPREIAGIESEHQASRRDEGQRLLQLMREFATPGHPLNGFGAGSADTLTGLSGEELREAAATWIAEHFIGHNVSVAASFASIRLDEEGGGAKHRRHRRRRHRRRRHASPGRGGGSGPSAPPAATSLVLCPDEFEALLLEGLSCLQRCSAAESRRQLRRGGGGAPPSSPPSGSLSPPHPSCPPYPQNLLPSFIRVAAVDRSVAVVAGAGVGAHPSGSGVSSPPPPPLPAASATASIASGAPGTPAAAAAATPGAVPGQHPQHTTDTAPQLRGDGHHPHSLQGGGVAGVLHGGVGGGGSDAIPSPSATFVFPIDGLGVEANDGGVLNLLRHYVGSLKEGSILSTLGHSRQATDGRAGLHCGRGWSLLTLSVALTPDGDADIDGVIVIVLRGLLLLRNALRSNGRDYWDGLRQISQLHESLAPAAVDVAGLAVSLHRLKHPSHFLRAEHCFAEFRPEELATAAGSIDPHNMLVMHTSAKHTGEILEYESAWGYDTPYTLNHITNSYITHWTRVGAGEATPGSPPGGGAPSDAGSPAPSDAPPLAHHPHHGRGAGGGAAGGVGSVAAIYPALMHPPPLPVTAWIPREQPLAGGGGGGGGAAAGGETGGVASGQSWQQQGAHGVGGPLQQQQTQDVPLALPGNVGGGVGGGSSNSLFREFWERAKKGHRGWGGGAGAGGTATTTTSSSLPPALNPAAAASPEVSRDGPRRRSRRQRQQGNRQVKKYHISSHAFPPMHVRYYEIRPGGGGSGTRGAPHPTTTTTTATPGGTAEQQRRGLSPWSSASRSSSSSASPSPSSGSPLGSPHRLQHGGGGDRRGRRQRRRRRRHRTHSPPGGGGGGGTLLSPLSSGASSSSSSGWSSSGSSSSSSACSSPSPSPPRAVPPASAAAAAGVVGVAVSPPPGGAGGIHSLPPQPASLTAPQVLRDLTAGHLRDYHRSVEGMVRVQLLFPMCRASYACSAAMLLFAELLNAELNSFCQEALQHGATLAVRPLRGSQCRLEIVCHGMVSIIPTFVDASFRKILAVLDNWCRGGRGDAAAGGSLHRTDYFVKSKEQAATHLLVESDRPEEPVLNAYMRSGHLLAGDAPHDVSRLIQGLTDLQFRELQSMLPASLLCPSAVDVAICGPAQYAIHSRAMSESLSSVFLPALYDLARLIPESPPAAPPGAAFLDSPSLRQPRTRLVPPLLSRPAAVGPGSGGAAPRTRGGSIISFRAPGGGVGAAPAVSAPAVPVAVKGGGGGGGERRQRGSGGGGGVGVRREAGHVHYLYAPQATHAEGASVAVMEMCFMHNEVFSPEEHCAMTRVLTEYLRIGLQQLTPQGTVQVLGATYTAHDSCTACVLYACSDLFDATELLSFLRVFADGVLALAAEGTMDSAALKEAARSACDVAAGQLGRGDSEGDERAPVAEWGSSYESCHAADLRGMSGVPRRRVHRMLRSCTAAAAGDAGEALKRRAALLAAQLSYTLATISPPSQLLHSLQPRSQPHRYARCGLSEVTLPAPARGSLPYAACLSPAPLRFLLVVATAAFTSHSTVWGLVDGEGSDSEL